MLIIRVCVVAVCAAIIFAMSKWQASEKKKTEPRKAVLLVTHVVKLACAALIAGAVVGQVVDLIG